MRDDVHLDVIPVIKRQTNHPPHVIVRGAYAEETTPVCDTCSRLAHVSIVGAGKDGSFMDLCMSCAATLAVLIAATAEELG